MITWSSSKWIGGVSSRVHSTLQQRRWDLVDYHRNPKVPRHPKNSETSCPPFLKPADVTLRQDTPNGLSQYVWDPYVAPSDPAKLKYTSDPRALFCLYQSFCVVLHFWTCPCSWATVLRNSSPKFLIVYRVLRCDKIVCGGDGLQYVKDVRMCCVILNMKRSFCPTIGNLLAICGSFNGETYDAYELWSILMVNNH